MAKRDPKEYLGCGPFDKNAFRTAYAAELGSVPKYNTASLPDLISMLEMIERDPAIIDIRWGAYMLATTFIESSTTIKVSKESKDKHGRTVVRTTTVWRNFSPIEERGHGRTYKYGKPVKVKRLPDGTARVTEYDGEQWIVSANGAARPTGKSPHRLGVAPTIAQPATSYQQDDGDEKHYYGRGFVQLTWWSNYARTGALLGRGLDLLFDPDLVEDPALAYQIISTGMRTGLGFANGHTFSQYFHGSHTDYVHARAMVNGHSGEREVADIAERFERTLFASKLKPRLATAT
jgi:hypothetical protein